MALNKEDDCMRILGNMLNESVMLHDVRSPTKCIDYISEEISYTQFLVRYLLPNRPCIFGKWVTANWRSVNEWVASDTSANLENLTSLFGTLKVPVAQCDAQEEYGAHPKIDMSLAEYVAYLGKMRQHNVGSDVDSTECRSPPLLYLKDWHFIKLCPDYEAYTVPVFFQHDWLNEYWDNRPDVSDDYRFVYIGPKNSWTPFHADVFRSYSWSANVCGRKRWLLLPPGEESKLKDPVSGRLLFDITQAKTDDVTIIEVVQNAGEVIFVPSGWHHQVCNLEETISINHNWINGCNADISWAYLKGHLDEVMHEIDHLKDMEQWAEQCQLILRASAGIDYREFYAMLCCTVGRRIKQLATRLHLLSTRAGDSDELLTCDCLPQSSPLEQPVHHRLPDISCHGHTSEPLCESDFACLTDKCVSLLASVKNWTEICDVLFEIILASRLLDSMLDTDEFSCMNWLIDGIVIHPLALVAMLRRLRTEAAALLLV